MPESLIRAVVTEEDAGRDNGLPNNPDDYKTKLLKYIPAETVTVYTTLAGIVVSFREVYPAWYWPGLAIVFLIGLVGTPLILTRAYGMKWKYKKWQIIITIVAYVLWVLSIGTFQEAIPVPSFIMTILLGGFTTLAPFIPPGINTSDEEHEGQAREKDTEEQNQGDAHRV
jgi:hypothetical protein